VTSVAAPRVPIVNPAKNHHAIKDSAAAAVDIDDRRTQSRGRDTGREALHRPRGNQRGAGTGDAEHYHRNDVERQRAQNSRASANVIRQSTGREERQKKA